MFGAKKVTFIKKNSLSLHRFFYGCATVIINLAAPVYIYSQTKNIYFSIIFLLAKYFFQTLVVLAAKNILTKNPLFSIALHTAFLFLCNSLLLFLQVGWASVIFLAFAYGAAEVFYIVALNVIFAVRIQNSLASVIQTPFTLGVLLLGVAKYTALPSFSFTGWAVLFIFLLHLVSIVPLMLDSRIPMLNAKAIEQTIIKPYKNVKRDIFHSSVGLLNGIVLEMIPLYLIFSQNSVKVSLLVFAAAEIARLLCSKIGELFYKNGLYNLAMALSCSLFCIFLTLAAFFKGSTAAYIFCVCAAVAIPLNFVPKFTTYVKTIKEENMIHYNQARREVFISAAKMLAPLVFLIFRTFASVLILGAIAAIVMFFSSYNFGKAKSAPPIFSLKNK